MKKRYYAAYGSNLNAEQMRCRCPDAKVVGTAELDGWRLLFKGSMSGFYLTIEQEEGSRVPVAIWEVSEADEARLDRFEGVPRCYYKKELVLDIKGIKSGKTRRRRVFLYIMHEERPLGVPTRRYVMTCAQGYRNFGFDLATLGDALYFSNREAVLR